MRELPSPQEILELFQQDPQRTFRLRELVLELGLRSSQARELKSLLKDLARSRKLVYLKKNHYALVHKGRHAAAETVAAVYDRRGEAPRLQAGGQRPPLQSNQSLRGADQELPLGGQRPPLQTAKSRSLVSGRLIGHRDGYGFVVPDAPLAGTDLDIYIPPDGMGSALHGDRVEVHVQRSTKGFRGEGRMEGRVVQVIERAQKTVVGQFHCGARYNYVMPFDQRIPFEIVIPRGQELPEVEMVQPTQMATPSHPLTPGPSLPRGRGEPVSQGLLSRHRQFGGKSEGRSTVTAVPDRRTARDLDGLIVDVEITNYPAPAALPRGRVLEVLGCREEFGVDVEIMIRKFHLPHRFPADVLAEASAAPQYIPERDREARRDFRGLPIVTIDGETAKDFDDAVYVERLASGNFLLHVHIADVSHYVRPGSALDREARLRGTSVYFPDRAVPMLPLELSNGICSLNPHVDRLVMSALMEFDAGGHLVECELLPGIIRSAERMTYTAVRDILAGEPAACQRYATLIPDFKRMEELARLLARRREQRGSIDFDLPEPEIEFDEHGRMTGITRSERNFAHRIIEEFMLAANEAVASYLEGKGIPSLYRIHEKPEAKKVIEFEEIAATFGYSLGIELPAARRTRLRLRDERDRHPRFHETFEGELKISPYNYQRLTQRLEGKPEERILSYLMLRSLKQARYSEENVGHFALAAPTYTHFTSPIRRYPDLIVHRILKAALAQEGGRARTTREQGVGEVLREREARAAEGEEKSTTVILSEAKDLRSSFRPNDTRKTAELRGVYPERTAGILRFAQNDKRRDQHDRIGFSQSFAADETPALPGAAFVHPLELHALGIETSEAERRAADAERELIEWKKVSFMAQHVGDEFEALIINLIKHGFFVELTDLFVEGFVPLANLGDDSYVYRERLRAIIGQHSKRAFRLGERLRVRLVRIDRSENKLEFSVAE
jgi:ribonuclease R